MDPVISGLLLLDLWRRTNMDKTIIPFWEETYQKDDVMTFSVEPNKTIKEFEHLIQRQSNILEVGCGEGQNVLYLAK